MEVIFRHGEGVDEFSFSVVFDIAQEDISLCLQRHNPPACIGLAGGFFNSLPQVLLDDIRSKLLCTEKRGVHLLHIIYVLLLSFRGVLGIGFGTFSVDDGDVALRIDGSVVGVNI